MEGEINPDATLDYVEFHLFPSQNRYEVSARSGNREENAASGPLEQLLLLDSPETKTLSNKGSNTNFKILPPENVTDARWFTTATLTRFLHIIGLPHILTIGKEISQLEETKIFQLSLSDKAEADITTSIESKNELLVAVDLRLTALKKEVVSMFNQAIGFKSSPNDISDIKNFGFHFGTNYLRDSLQSSVDIGTTLTEDEDSAVSSEDDEPSVERSRGLTRAAMPRRSASPMRRIQIGRSGSRRAASISIRSLNYIPVKEKSTSQREAAGNSSEEEDSQRPPKNNVLRMSVQDKISLFESKQRNQAIVDIHKTKTSVGANKSVLRRWSSEIGEKNEISAPCSPKNVESDSITNETETCVETSENILSVSGEGSSEQCRVEVDVPELSERDDSCEKNHATFNWSQQKGAERKLFNELIESKSVGHQNVTGDNTKHKSPKEQRGGFYDLYKKKREEKLQGEASRKIVEKEAKMASTKVIGSNRKLNATNELQKTQKNSTQLINSRTKPSVKKSTSKSSPVPATRKSWPSTPSPVRTQMTPISTHSTPTIRKPKSASSNVRSSTKVENLQPKLKTLKATQQDANKTVKSMNEKKQPEVTESKRMTKTFVQSSKADTTPAATAKPSFYNKVTTKNSVVPLETKPFLRKGSGTGLGVGPVIKSKVVAQKTEENKVVTRINTTSENQENGYEQPETHANLDLEHQVVSLGPSPTKCEASESSGDGGSSRVEVSEFSTPTEEKIEISPTAWVVTEEHQQDEIIPFKESPIKTSSPANVESPAGSAHPRVRHSLSQMLLEDNHEVEIGEWGNAEHPPTMVYQKDAPRGLIRLLKFARKAKADSHLAASWSSPSAISEGEDDTEESKSQSSLSRYNMQNHQRQPEGHVSASINSAKATRSFFSLSAFRGNKNETKLLHH